MSKFDHALSKAMEGSYVYAASADGREYEGWVETIHPKYQHVILRDATNVSRDRDAGRVFVRQVDTIEELESGRPIERVALDDIEPAPYNVRDLDPAAKDTREFIATIRDRGFVESYPVVRPHPDGDGYQIVEGHRRVAAAIEAGLDTHPVAIDDELDDWELTRRFITEHLPDESQVRDDVSTCDNCYDDDETEAAIGRLRADWGDRVLDVDEVAYNIDRLGLDEAADDTEDADDAENATETEQAAEPNDPADDGDEAVSGDDTASEPEQSMEEVVGACDGVGPVTVEVLAREGYDTLEALATADREDLTDIDRVGRAIAYRVIEAAEAAVSDEGNDSDVDVSGSVDEGVVTDGSGTAAQSASTREMDVVDVDTPGESMDDPSGRSDEIIEKYLPAGETRESVRELARDEDALDVVADELGIAVGDARVLLFHLDVNDEVTEASRYRGGVP